MMLRLLLACPMCFGAENSEQVHAAKVGVLVLLGCIVPLLVAIALVARSWAKRARELDAAEGLGRSVNKPLETPAEA